MFISTAYAAVGEGSGGSVFATPEFWVGVAFVLFLGLMFYLKLPGRLLGMLDARADRIRDELEQAKALREEAQQAYAECQRKAEDAAREAESIISYAREESAMMAEKMRRELEESLARRKAHADARIAQAEQQAIDDVRRRAIDVASAAAAQILHEQMKGEAGSALIDRAIGDIGKHLN